MCVCGHADKNWKEFGWQRGQNTTKKKLSCLGFSVVAIFPGKYSYLMYWMISEHLKNNCFQIKEPIVGNVGYK